MTELTAWFKNGLGRSLQMDADLGLINILPRNYYSTALDLGPGTFQHFDKLDIQQLIRVNPLHIDTWSSTVIGEWCDLPFGRNTVDLIVLEHTLDFSHNPRSVLRESIQVLNNEGWIAILGFNPMGIWGISQILLKKSGKAPWSGNFIRISQLQDWLKLSGTTVVEVKYFFYRPPTNSPALLHRLEIIEKLGTRWWPALSGGYIILAQKKQLTGTHVLNARRPQKQSVASEVMNTI